MPQHLETYLDEKKSTIARLQQRPIILKWMESAPMKGSLEVIDKHVEYLDSKPGGRGKLQQWLLSSDRNFYEITAERYILWYLRQQNEDIHDNLSEQGIDGHMDTPNGTVGIEVTSLSAFIAESIFIERLTEMCRQDSRLRGRGFDLTYSWDRIQACEQDEEIYIYIRQVAEALASQDGEKLEQLQVDVKYEDDYPGNIVWHVRNSDSYPWFDRITRRLTPKLQTNSKVRQLSTYQRNLVFVGINHLSPINGMFPDLFRYLAGVDGYNPHEEMIESLENCWSDTLPTLQNVNGICYFFYSLDQETPFYPLRMFWRSPADQIYINL